MDPITRREWLIRGASLATAGIGTALGACGNVDRRDRDTDESRSIRSLFELDPDRVHLAAMLLSSHPRPVREALEHGRHLLDANPIVAWESLQRVSEDAAFAAAARYMGVQAQDVAITHSTTMGLAMIYAGVTIRPDQEFLTTVHDHPATTVSITHRAAKTGSPVRRIRLYDDGEGTSAEAIVERLASELRPNTRVVGLTWVHSTSGIKLPIRMIADAIVQANAGRAPEDRILLCVDGAHGFGVEDVSIADLGCDFFASGCHKWLFGPRGTGVIWGKPDAQAFVHPTVPTFSGTRSWGREMTPGGFHAFEHRWAMPAAFEMHERIGRDRVQQRTHELAAQCKEGLRSMHSRGVMVYTPMDRSLSSGIVCFGVEGYSARTAVARLRAQRIVASASPYTPSLARFSPCVFNEPDDVDRALVAVRSLLS